MPQDTKQEEDNPRHDAETSNQKKEPGDLVLSEEVPPHEDSRLEVNEKILDTEQSDLT